MVSFTIPIFPFSGAEIRLPCSQSTLKTPTGCRIYWGWPMMVNYQNKNCSVQHCWKLNQLVILMICNQLIKLINQKSIFPVTLVDNREACPSAAENNLMSSAIKWSSNMTKGERIINQGEAEAVRILTSKKIEKNNFDSLDQNMKLKLINTNFTATQTLGKVFTFLVSISEWCWVEKKTYFMFL